MIALDSNLLIYAHRAGCPEHALARKALERAAAGDAGWGFALPCLAEFWSVVTHPACPPRPSTPDQASRFVDGLLKGGAQVWLPSAGFASRFLRVAADRKLSGARVFDLQIAMIAFESGASELWSHDAKFRTVPGLGVVDPLQEGR